MNFITVENMSIALFFVGIFGLLARRNIVKTIISIGILQSAVILYFISINYEDGLNPPIGDVTLNTSVDPVPQALMITAIIIGVAVTAVSLTMFISLYHRYGTTNWTKALQMRRGER